LDLCDPLDLGLRSVIEDLGIARPDDLGLVMTRPSRLVPVLECLLDVLVRQRVHPGRLESRRPRQATKRDLLSGLRGFDVLEPAHDGGGGERPSLGLLVAEVGQVSLQLPLGVRGEH
jgi:hypothetical protein